MTDLNYFVIATRSAGVPAFPELIELVLPAAQKASNETGLSLEYAVIEQAKAVYAAAHQKSKAGPGQNVDFPAFVREKLGKTDSLLSKLLGRKSRVQQSIAELEAYEADVNQSKEALRNTESKIEELNQEIEKATSELSAHTEEAVAQSIQEAAQVYHLRSRNPHLGSVVDAAIFHAAHADIVNRILNARLILLKDQLETEATRQTELKKHLKDLEKQAA
jgi:DNA repair exonuclease SbcCD ATPase subunit